MIRRPPRSTRTDTRFPYTTLFRSPAALVGDAGQWPLRFHQPARGAVDVVGDFERAAKAVRLRTHDHEILHIGAPPGMRAAAENLDLDRKSTRLNSSH